MSLEREPFALRIYGSVGSTNDIARAEGQLGHGANIWFTAREQRTGRGRQGRSWHSPPGNFYGSLLVRPRRTVAACATLSLVTALAVAEALDELAGRQGFASLKWPNDVRIGGAKVAGILLEADAGLDPHPRFVVIGIGLNVSFAPFDAPYPVTSLAEAGLSVDLDQIARVLRAHVEERFADWRECGFSGLRSAWLERAFGLGDEVAVKLGDGDEVNGRFAGIDACGSLLLVEDGRKRHLSTGEVVFRGLPEGSLTRAASD